MTNVITLTLAKLYNESKRKQQQHQRIVTQADIDSRPQDWWEKSDSVNAKMAKLMRAAK